MMYEQDEVLYGHPLPNNYLEIYYNQMKLFANSKLRAAVVQGDWDGITYLLFNGADVNSRSSYGCSVLHLAMKKDRYDIAEILLSRGAAVNESLELEGSMKGYTALHLACRDKKWDFAELLLEEYHAEVNSPAADGSLPIHFAVEGGNIEILQLLLDHGANSNVEFTKKLFEKMFVDKTWGDQYKNYTVLAHAISCRNFAVAGLLIEHGAEISQISNKKVPLFYAIESDSSTVVKFVINKIKEKVDIKTYMEKVAIRGFQPIQYAVLKGNSCIVEVLLEAGANANAEFRRVHYVKYLGYKSWTRKHSNTISLLTHATTQNDLEMVEILKKFGAKETPPICN